MLSTGLRKPWSGVDHPELHHHCRCYNNSAQTYKSAEASAREPRFARPSYNEEQKFFIMHHRIVKKLSWPEVENEFARYYKLRSKNGLTSVYYRIRGSWGMGKILKNKARSENDLSVIERKAEHFSRAFLENIGYFDWAEESLSTVVGATLPPDPKYHYLTRTQVRCFSQSTGLSTKLQS
jgi:hypothetical protein